MMRLPHPASMSLPQAYAHWVLDLGWGPPRAAQRVRSGHLAAVWRFDWDDRSAYLKVAPSLTGERERLQWLAGRVRVPAVLAWRAAAEKDADWLLTAALPGQDLADRCQMTPPRDIVRSLAEALLRFHALPMEDCPFPCTFPCRAGAAPVILHGDACLPNVVIDATGESGYIDLGDAAIGPREIDLAAAVWSLHHNLGPGYGGDFLRAYGWSDCSATEVDRLRAAY